MVTKLDIRNDYGLQLFTVDDNGKITVDTLNENIGINTISPRQKLDVNGNIQADSLFLDNSAENSVLVAGLNGEIILNSSLTYDGNNLDVNGNILPTTDASYDLGSTTLRWNNVYTTDLHLSNENKKNGNDIDGTTGNWTLQEGEETLYLINNRNGKQYKILLEEIE